MRGSVLWVRKGSGMSLQPAAMGFHSGWEQKSKATPSRGLGVGGGGGGGGWCQRRDLPGTRVFEEARR